MHLPTCLGNVYGYEFGVTIIPVFRFSDIIIFLHLTDHIIHMYFIPIAVIITVVSLLLLSFGGDDAIAMTQTVSVKISDIE